MVVRNVTKKNKHKEITQVDHNRQLIQMRLHFNYKKHIIKGPIEICSGSTVLLIRKKGQELACRRSLAYCKMIYMKITIAKREEKHNRIICQTVFHFLLFLMVHHLTHHVWILG